MGIGRRTCQRSRRFLPVLSGRLGSLVWHVRGGHVCGQGMDQLVARMVFFGRRGGERMEGTTFLFFFFSADAFHSAVTNVFVLTHVRFWRFGV